MKRTQINILFVLVLWVIVANVLVKVVHAQDMLMDIWEIVQNLLPMLLTSPLIFILLFKFWGGTAFDILMKLKWIAVMIIPTAILYIAVPDIANYTIFPLPYWFFYISPPLVVDCIIGYAIHINSVSYLQFGLVWLLCIYGISFYLIVSSGKNKRKNNQADQSSKKRSKYIYLLSPVITWGIFSLWGFLMVNTHLLLFNSLLLLGSSGFWIVIAVIIITIVIYFIIKRMYPKEFKSRNPDENLLYCTNISPDKTICVYKNTTNNEVRINDQKKSVQKSKRW